MWVVCSGMPLACVLGVVKLGGGCQESNVAHRRDGYVELDATEGFREWSDTELHTALATLTAANAHVGTGFGGCTRCVVLGALARRALEDLQQVIGVNYNPLGLLWSDVLRGKWDPIRDIRYDWVHSALQDGAFSVEVALVLQVPQRSTGRVGSATYITFSCVGIVPGHGNPSGNCQGIFGRRAVAIPQAWPCESQSIVQSV